MKKTEKKMQKEDKNIMKNMKKEKQLKEKKEKLLAELETQIKVSNATTLIEF